MQKKYEQTNSELQGGERHLPAPRTETYGIAKPALQASAAAGGGNASASCSRKKIPRVAAVPEHAGLQSRSAGSAARAGMDLSKRC